MRVEKCLDEAMEHGAGIVFEFSQDLNFCIIVFHDEFLTALIFLLRVFLNKATQTILKFITRPRHKH